MSAVRPGYKQTEVGVIPEDWEPTEVSMLGQFKGGGTPSMAITVYWENGVIPWVSSGDVKTQYISSTAKMITEEAVKKSSTNLLPKGSILFVTRSGILRKYFPVALNMVSVAINQDIKALIPKDSFAADYLLYALIVHGPQILSTCMKSGTTVESVEYNWLKKYKIPIPPTLAEQATIAEVLSDTDALIQGLDQLIAKKRNIKQGAMQELLTGKRRLSRFDEVWKEKRIGEFAECSAGGTPSTMVPSYWGGQIKWMSSGELNMKVVRDVDGRITERGLRESSTKMIPAKCILIGLAGQGKTRGTVAINMIELCTNQSIAAIFPSSAYLPEYLFYNLDARYDELRELSAGDGGRGGLNLTIIKSLQILLPSLAEQTAIAAVLSDMDAEIAALEQKRDKYKAIKQGMMQELLTGKTRLV